MPSDMTIVPQRLALECRFACRNKTFKALIAGTAATGGAHLCRPVGLAPFRQRLPVR